MGPAGRSAAAHLEQRLGPHRGAVYVSAVLDFCEHLDTFPLRGTPRDDLLPGLRLITYKRRTVIAYKVEGDEVLVLGAYHGGQDYEAALSEAPDAVNDLDH